MVLILSVDHFIQSLFSDLINGESRILGRLRALLADIHPQERRVMLFSLMRNLFKQHLTSFEDNPSIAKSSAENTAIGAVAAVLAAITETTIDLQDCLVEWLVSISADAVRQNHSSHRAVIRTVSVKQGNSSNSHVVSYEIAKLPSDQIGKALQRSLELFGDKLYIKHTPTLHQEGSTLSFISLTFC